MMALLQEIEAFCAKHGFSDWQFGEMALRDKHFVRQLRDGRDLRMSTVERVRQKMAEHEAGQKSAA